MTAHSPNERPANRLASQSSLYLQQHALNPVDWYPWGPEAFEKARAEDKPIFLSIGYSACHWCHVMEHESFENQSIADYLNQHYVSIKVDREERPDLDQIYMSAVQLITRRGGWPMSVFLTPDGAPFFGGTYWPPTSRMGMPGFSDILVKLQDYWKNRRDEVETSAQDLVQAVSELAAPVLTQVPLSVEVLRHACQELVRSADRKNGGFGGAPKFPHSMDIRVLLRGWKRFGEEAFLQTALLALRKMADGGIYDHLGGGFHRYSTDAFWLVPHFEKMLYDNALLVPAYLEAWQITQDPTFERVVRETLDYVLREMTSPNGGFYSTQDADSEGEEGKFFVWTEQEIHEVLGEADATLFSEAYDVSRKGNWEGHTILNRARSVEEVATLNGMSVEDLETRLKSCREKLLQVRKLRIAPARDEKILTNWNGMMITAFAQAGFALNDPRYLEAAARASDFLLQNCRDPQGQLLHSSQNGQSILPAYLDDYACLIDGLVETSQACQRWDLLDEARQLAEQTVQKFRDPVEGGRFFYTAADHEQLITRTKDSEDNATPSGNGMLATALLKLGRLTGKLELEQVAVQILDSLSGLLADHPRAVGQSLIAYDALLGPVAELVISASESDSGETYLNLIRKQYLPNKLVIFNPEASPAPLDLSRDKPALNGAALYVCERGVCQLPATDPQTAEMRLQEF